MEASFPLNDSPLVIPDLQDSQVYALAQAAGRAGLPVEGTSPVPLPWIERSRYVRRWAEIPCLHQVVDGLYARELKHSGLQGVWLPAVDNMLDFTVRYRPFLEYSGFRFLAPEADAANRLFALEGIHSTSAIRVPFTAILTNAELFDRAETWNYPLMLKSMRNMFRRVDDAAELRAHLQENGATVQPETVQRIQHYVEGPVARMASAMLLFDDAGRPVRGFTGRRLRVERTAFGPFGETTAARAEWIPELYEGACEILSTLGWRGFAEVECKQGADGHWYLMEINPRLSGWAVLAEADGAGLLSAYHRICAGSEVLEEACTQRSQAEYVRVVSAGDHLPDWVSHGEGDSLPARVVRTGRALWRYRRNPEWTLLGAWDRCDRKASGALARYALKQFLL